MQIAVWIIIILVVIFLIWLLRRWIRRIIFILILLILAFLIYGIFNPSGAARLWYNVRTFPERMAGWMGSGKEFLDYDSYKSKISSVGDSISDTIDSVGDKIDSVGDEINNIGNNIDIDVDLNDGGDNSDLEGQDNDEEEDIDVAEGKIEDASKDEEDSSKNTGKKIIKAFPKSIHFIEIPDLKQGIESGKVGVLSGYSRTDLLGVINRYLEKNLDDDTDVLVTVEYENDSADPLKIILQTQSKNEHSTLNSNDLMDEVFSDSERRVPEEIEIIPAESMNSEGDESQSTQKQESIQNPQKTSNKPTSNKLTQQEQKEAEEIFGILF